MIFLSRIENPLDRAEAVSAKLAKLDCDCWSAAVAVHETQVALVESAALETSDPSAVRRYIVALTSLERWHESFRLITGCKEASYED